MQLFFIVISLNILVVIKNSCYSWVMRFPNRILQKAIWKSPHPKKRKSLKKRYHPFVFFQTRMASIKLTQLSILQTLNIEPETLNYFKLQKKCNYIF